MAELQQSSIEKTLLNWCRERTSGYRGVDIRNFTTSWADGLAFCALLHNWRPNLLNYDEITRQHPLMRLETAFSLSYHHLGIERFLDPEGSCVFSHATRKKKPTIILSDLNTSSPDKKSILMYVMCLFQSLSSANKSSPPPRPVSIALGSYQASLEEVLTWLLGAEDRLASPPPCGRDLLSARLSFQEFTTFLQDLASHQVRFIFEKKNSF